MAAGKNQTEAIIFDLLVIFIFNGGRVADARFHVGNKIFLRSIEARPPAHRIDGLEACGRNQPGARVSGMPVLGQDSSAAANASCMASSARSRSPRMRTSVARTRPDSDR